MMMTKTTTFLTTNTVAKSKMLCSIKICQQINKIAERLHSFISLWKKSLPNKIKTKHDNILKSWNYQYYHLIISYIKLLYTEKKNFCPLNIFLYSDKWSLLMEATDEKFFVLTLFFFCFCFFLHVLNWTAKFTLKTVQNKFFLLQFRR